MTEDPRLPRPIRVHVTLREREGEIIVTTSDGEGDIEIHRVQEATEEGEDEAGSPEAV